MMQQAVTFLALVAQGELGALEERWLELFADPPRDGAALAEALGQAVETIRALRAAGHAGLAASLVGIVPEDVEQGVEPEIRLAFAAVLAEHSPADPSVRRRLRDAYRARYKGRRGLDALLELAGVYKEETAPSQVVSQMKRLLRYEEGGVIRHSSWGTGTIRKVDRFTAELVIDFAQRKNHRMSPDAAIQGLEVLPADDFDALAFADPERIRELLRKDPLEALRMLLVSVGGKSDANQIRDRLRGPLIESEKWSGWWTRVKKQAMGDPFIEVIEDRPVRLALREQGLSYLDECIAQMRATRRFSARWELARRFLRHGGDGDARIWGELAADLARPLAEHDEDDHTALLDAAVLRGVPLDSFLRLPRLDRLWVSLPPAGQRIFGEAIRAGREEWSELFVDAFWREGCRVRPWIREALLEGDPGLLAGMDAAVVQDPTRDPERFLPLAEHVLDGRWAPSAATSDPFELLIDLMLVVRSFERGRSVSKDFVRPAVKLLAEGDSARVLQLVEQAPAPRVARAARLLHGSDSLESILVHVGPALHARLPDLNLEGEAPFWENAPLLVTRRSLEARRAKLLELMEREMPKVEKQIGHAASFGDLSENSEWSAAIERRNQLVEQIERMKRELNTAQPLESQPVETSQVCPGTRVRLQRADRTEPETLTILGPWDVDVAAGVLSYLSPLAAGLLGHAPGEEVTVELPEGSAIVRVIEIEKAV